MFRDSPRIAAQMWGDLQTLQSPDGGVLLASAKRNVRYYLMAYHHLRRYPTEHEREAMFDVSPKHGQEWVWFFVNKIRNLKHHKIAWPAAKFSELKWAISVDGMHCWIAEPKHPHWSQDRTYFSHKYSKAGLNYELGISLEDSHLVWMAGPFRAG